MKWWSNAEWWNSDEMGLCVQGIATEKKKYGSWPTKYTALIKVTF